MRFWGGGGLPPILRLGRSKKNVSEKVGTVGELYKIKIMKKWGRTSPLIGSYPEWWVLGPSKRLEGLKIGHGIIQRRFLKVGSLGTKLVT